MLTNRVAHPAVEFADSRQDIQTCQNLGKIVLLGLGGAIGTYGFSDSSEASAFATTVWEMFGEGWGSTRPFGLATVDGFNLDIESGSTMYYDTFVNTLRSYTWYYGSKYYYVTAAPQCPYPDAYLGDALDSTYFDMVFIQFYNNYCNVGTGYFNYDIWQWWVYYQSPAWWTKLYVGVAASSNAASSGYISPTQLAQVISPIQSGYEFGGIMMWDANKAFSNVHNKVNYAQAAKNALLA